VRVLQIIASVEAVHHVVSHFSPRINETLILLGFYTASNGRFLPKFRIKLSVLFSSVKESKKNVRPLDPCRWTDRLSPKRREKHWKYTLVSINYTGPCVKEVIELVEDTVSRVPSG
jgi:hypothetical protein